MKFEKGKFELCLVKAIDQALRNEIISLFIYGSNVESFLELDQNIISNEIDLLFVMKKSRSKRNSDIDRKKFSGFINYVKSEFPNIKFMYNGEIPQNIEKECILVDIISDNLDSISLETPTSVVTKILPKKLIYGVNPYDSIKKNSIDAKDFLFLIHQKNNYLNRVYEGRSDSASVSAYSKGVEFLLSWLYDEKLLQYLEFSYSDKMIGLKDTYLKLNKMHKTKTLDDFDKDKSIEVMNKLEGIIRKIN